MNATLTKTQLRNTVISMIATIALGIFLAAKPDILAKICVVAGIVVAVVGVFLIAAYFLGKRENGSQMVYGILLLLGGVLLSIIPSALDFLVPLLFGIWVAWEQDSVIFQVVSYAWAGLGASFGPLTLFSLYWRRTTKWGAVAGMVTGAVMVIVWHNWIKGLGGVFGIYELLPAFLLSCLAIFVVSKLTREPEREVLDEFDHYMDEDAPIEERSLDDVLAGEIPVA